MRTVLITGMGGQAALSILKCLRLAGGYRIITTDIDPLRGGIYRGDKGYIVPTEEKAFIRRLNKICIIEKVDVIVPGSDFELSIFARKKRMFKTPILFCAHAVLLARDKYETAKWLKANGLKAPKTWLMTEIPSNLKYPVIIKPRYGWGSNYLFEANDENELKTFSNYLLRNGQIPIIQEKLVGKEYSGMGLVGKDGTILSITCAESVKKFGMSFKTIHGNENDYIPQKTIIAKILAKSQIKGPLSVQMIGDTVFEMNARFTGAQIVRAVAGVNGPDILIKNFLDGKKVYPTSLKLIALWYADYFYITEERYKNLVKKKETEIEGFFPGNII